MSIDTPPRRVPTGARTATRRWDAWHRSTPVATAGLAVVLLLLTVFSVAAAVGNARAAGQAERGAAVSTWSERASESLAAQEDLADELAVAPDPELRAEYDAAVESTREALIQLGRIEGTGHAPLVANWLNLQDRYRAAVERLLVVGAADPGAADDFEDTYVDPFYDDLEAVVVEESRQHQDDAAAELRSMGRTQRALVVVTPLAFAVGLSSLAYFMYVLTRSRRTTARQADEIRHQALHDALTGLPNRVLLRERITEALASRERTAAPGPLAVLLVDLDRFKEINDTLGHHYGDVVLQAVASRLTATLRSSDTVARLGGDEFAVLLPVIDGDDAALEVAAKIRGVLEAAIEVEGLWLGVEASVGVVVAADGDRGSDELLQHADIAMYVAKERGLGVVRYESDLNGHSVERLGLLGELRHALDRGELVLHYQPKVSLTGANVVSGVEALVRWQHPVRGLLPPDVFIPLAERTALIGRLTQYVLDTALAQVAAWHHEGLDVHVAVNISARNLSDDRFVDEVARALQRWDIAPDRLELEITESAVLADPQRGLAILARLAELGVRLSIDDFGAGYTSLSHLKSLPVGTLKIDRSFVSTMSRDVSDALIVRSVIELGHNLGMSTVAEGVEDLATWNQLADLGCDVAQGYYLTRPMPADDVREWLRAWPPTGAPTAGRAGVDGERAVVAGP